LGPLAAGTYTTQLFRPRITYQTPDGWANLEDLPGNFLLIPPGGSSEGVDAGTSDYIGIYTSISALAPKCETELSGTGRDPADIVEWLTAQSDLKVTDGGPTEVGGLTGQVVDLSLREGGGLTCEGQDFPIIPLFLGRAPSELEHAMIPGLTMRLYLLEFGDGTLAIEVDDVAGGTHLDEYSELVANLRFGD